jgi:hypothetical protein
VFAAVVRRFMFLPEFCRLEPASGSHPPMAFERGSGTPSLGPPAWPRSSRSSSNLVNEDLGALVRSVAQVPAPQVASITDGKHSRLVRALIVQEGLADRFEFCHIAL